MSSIPQVVQESTRPATGRSRLIASLGAAVIGLALLYLAGFTQADALHDGTHDARHSATFPCH